MSSNLTFTVNWKTWVGEWGEGKLPGPHPSSPGNSSSPEVLKEAKSPNDQGLKVLYIRRTARCKSVRLLHVSCINPCHHGARLGRLWKMPVVLQNLDASGVSLTLKKNVAEDGLEYNGGGSCVGFIAPTKA